MPTTETAVPIANALDADALPLADYRAIREGRAVPVVVKEEETPGAPPAVKPEAETATDSETGEDNKEEEQEEPKPKRDKGDKLKARFSELTGKIRDLEGQLAVAKTSGAVPVEGTKADGAKPDGTKAAAAEPKAEDYADWNAYQRDLIRWEAKAELKAETQRQAQQVEQARFEQLRAAKAQRWQAQVEAAQSRYADFDTVAQNPKLPITPVMAEAITDTDVGPDILHHLGSHPELASRISQLSPVAQVREIGKLEATLAVEEAEESEPVQPLTPKPVSQAPKPARQLHGRASTPNPASPRNIEGMSQSEYRALRESGKLA